jgi:hypothetical protein
MSAKAGAITVPSGAGAVPVTGFGTRPGCVLFFGTNQVTEDTTLLTPSPAWGGFFGWCASTSPASSDSFVSMAMLGGGGNAQCSHLAEQAVYMQSIADSFGSSVLYQATATLDPDGFTLNFSTGAGGGYKVHYLMIGGVGDAFIIPWGPSGACDFHPYTVDTGQVPGVFFSLGQWRDSCHLFPKSTTFTMWNNIAFGDLDEANRSVWSAFAQSSIGRNWSSGAEAGNPMTPLGAVGDPFFFGSIVTGTHYIRRVAPNSVEFEQQGAGDGYEHVTASFGGDCFRGDVSEVIGIGGGAIDSEVAISLPEIAGACEAVVFNNFQHAATTEFPGLNRLGIGFATPTYQAGFSITAVDGSFFQSSQYSWVSKTSGIFASAGTVNFTPSFGDISLVTQLNDAGNGDIGLMGFKTLCPTGFPLLVSFSGAQLFRPSGSQITTRGGHITAGEGGTASITIEP